MITQEELNDMLEYVKNIHWPEIESAKRNNDTHFDIEKFLINKAITLIHREKELNGH